jgi:hypothetical protein
MRAAHGGQEHSTSDIEVFISHLMQVYSLNDKEHPKSHKPRFAEYKVALKLCFHFSTLSSFFEMIYSFLTTT